MPAGKTGRTAAPDPSRIGEGGKECGGGKEGHRELKPYNQTPEHRAQKTPGEMSVYALSRLERNESCPACPATLLGICEAEPGGCQPGVGPHPARTRPSVCRHQQAAPPGEGLMSKILSRDQSGPRKEEGGSWHPSFFCKIEASASPLTSLQHHRSA